MDCTTPPKEDKLGPSSAEAPMAQALVACPESEADGGSASGGSLQLSIILRLRLIEPI
jgi:hypothetical protein